jgi:hypothetical protein
MKQLKQSLRTKSRRLVKRQNKPGMRVRAGVKAGVGSMVYGDDVLWN